MGFGAFFSAVSGVKGHLFSMSIVGNNIANSNTIGFKTGQVTFREALVQTLRGSTPPSVGGGGGINPVQVGLGMEVASIHTKQGQGMLQETGIVTDLAIEGQGFFVVSDGDSNFYTRAGNFTLDSEGNMVNRGTGHIVQGWLADDDGRIPTGSPIEDLRLPFGVSIPGRATTEVSLDSNLNAAATSSTASLNSAGTTGVLTVQGMAADGAGGQHQVTLTGTNSTQSTALGSNTAGVPLTGSETLMSMGVTQYEFDIVLNNNERHTVRGLGADSRIDELIQAINNLGIDVMAERDAGEVRLTHKFAGDGTLFNITLENGQPGNIAREVFGAPIGGDFIANNGTSSTLTATGVFTPTGHAPLGSENLVVTINPDTGLADSIEGVGDGGILIQGDPDVGLSAGTLLIDTEPTEHLTSLNIFDSLGNTHVLNLTFRRSGVDNLWYWEGNFDEGETISSGRSGTVQFNRDGSIQSWLFDNGGDTMTLNPGQSADPITLNFAAGTPGDFDGLTQFAAPFTAKASQQDGYSMGTLDSISVDRGGLVTGFFSNGVLRNMGQIVLAKFNNPDGLLRSGANIYRMSSNSGDPVIGSAGITIPGSIASGALEMSNVDLSEEFVRMIVAQRGFQANARVITTGDEMMTDMINLKR